jgi:hypothetical protein
MSGTAYGHLDYLTAKEVGSVTIQPNEPVVVGSFGTYTLTYVVGIYGLDVGGSLKIGNRRMSDWGQPQFDDPQAPNHVTVECSVPTTRLSARYDPRGYVRPFRAVIDIFVEKGALYPGDQIIVNLGDRSGGSPGMQAQSFPESECLFAVFVDCMNGGVWAPVPHLTPPLKVITGPAVGISLQGPSQAIAGRPFRVKVNGYDIFGNPTPTDETSLVIEADTPHSLSLESRHGRSLWVEDIILEQPGIHHLKLTRNGEEVACSNPIKVTADTPSFNLYWGDTQAQTASTVGTGTVEEYYAYARDVAGIDFCTHQANDFMVHQAVWDEVVEGTYKFHEPNRFVSILGWEWSGTAAAGGDRNVLFSGDQAPIYRSNSWHLPQGDPENERPTAADLHQSIREYLARSNDRVVLIPHVGGRRVDIDSVDTSLEPVFEICSCHGIFEWWLREALEKGLRIGVLGASDDHTCRPGLAYPSTPEMAIRGGLGAVYARDLTRNGILEALSARRCYGTSGERISVWVDADGHPLGSEFTAIKPPTIHVEVNGTAPLDEICLYDGNREVYAVHPNPRQRDNSRLRVIWTGAEGRDRNRYTRWDGNLKLSKGRFVSVQPLNMYTPKEKAYLKGATEIRWRSITAGHQVGILVEVDSPDEAVIAFESGPASFEFTLETVRREDLFVDAGGEQRSVMVSTQHSKGDKKEVLFDFDTAHLPSGAHAYWVRVIQSDFHRAWTSPVYVTVEDE